MLFFDIVQKISYSNSEVLNYRVSQKNCFLNLRVQGPFCGNGRPQEEGQHWPQHPQIQRVPYFGTP